MPKRRRILKMFVWEDIMTDYTPGLACALAYDVDEARKVLVKKANKKQNGSASLEDGLKNEPQIIEAPEGFYVHGGG